MTSSLQRRLTDIPGVASVVVDVDGIGRGIDVRLEPGANEEEVMEKLRALLAAYGVKRDHQPAINREEPSHSSDVGSHHGVEVSISPTNSGARVEVATPSVRSFRLVAATPLAIAQGMADAWCQVIGKVPVEITDVGVEGESRLVVTASDGERETRGVGDISAGWVDALTTAISGALVESDGLQRAAS